MKAFAKQLIRRQRQQMRQARRTMEEQLGEADHLSAKLHQASKLVVAAYSIVVQLPLRDEVKKMKLDCEMDLGSIDSHALMELITRSQRGDEIALRCLTIELDDSSELWSRVGDLAQHVESSWIKLLSGDNLLTGECLRREADRRRQELLGDSPSAIERHLIETIVASWLHVKYAEVQAAVVGQVSDRRERFLTKRLEKAREYHLSAIEQLMKIRNLTKS